MRTILKSNVALGAYACYFSNPTWNGFMPSCSELFCYFVVHYTENQLEQIKEKGKNYKDLMNRFIPIPNCNKYSPHWNNFFLLLHVTTLTRGSSNFEGFMF